MKIISLRTLTGPNFFSHNPVIRAVVDLGSLAEVPSCEVPGFTDRLLDVLPGLQEHRCSKGYPGGFVERLRTGTYFGHILEHTVLELTGFVGKPVGFGKTIYSGTPGQYAIAVAFEAEEATKYLMQAGIELLEAVVEDRPFALQTVIDRARTIACETELGPSTLAIIEAANRRGIPWRRLSTQSLVQLGHGVQRRLVQATETQFTSSIAVDIASDKHLTKQLLAEAGIPVPRGGVVFSNAEADSVLQSLSLPVVVKPLDGNQGRGVELNLTSEGDVLEAVDRALELSHGAIVEERLEGRDYRTLVVNGAVVAVSERTPAHVVGDGVRTVAQLVELENLNPLRGSGHEKPLTRLSLDTSAKALLARRGLSELSVPASGEKVFLRETANLSTGGTARDVTDLIHPTIARACVRAAKMVGLDVCGIDIVHYDISKPWRESGSGIVEVNAAPGIRMHESPSSGLPRRAGDAIVETLYPNGENGRIPIIAITGTNGKTTVTRLVAHLVSAHGLRVGMTTSDGVFIDDDRVMEGDTTGYQSALAVLSDPTVEAAVLETARGGIVRRGLAFDWCDIAILTNIQRDHFGQDGIDDVFGLVKAKSLIAERVREGGTLILNADDAVLRRITRREGIAKIPKNIVYYSACPLGAFLRRQLARGGRVYFVENGWLMEAEEGVARRVIKTSEFPHSMHGRVAYQVSNGVSAVAAARAFGLSVFEIQTALRTFKASQNPGRFNWYKVKEGYVVVDYGHNPAAFKALQPAVRAWEGRTTGIIGLPGDRTDELLRDAAHQAVRLFDKVIVREDEDKRGRREGEVASLIEEVLREHFPSKEYTLRLPETEALSTAIEEMEKGELIIIFYEHFSEVERVLKAYDAVPSEGPPDSAAEPKVESSAPHLHAVGGSRR